MIGWWNTLNLLQQMFLCAAVPFTVVLIIQTILTFVGLAGHGEGGDVHADADVHADVHLDHADGVHDAHTDDVNAGVGDFRFFTVRGIVAFFCVFGWVGYLLAGSSTPIALIILISLAAGLLAMLAIGLMFYATHKLQDSGNIRFSNAVGHAAQVYVPIPPMREGRGKVMVIIQERLVEAEAITDEATRLKTGETVQVAGSFGNTLIVKK